MAPRVLLALGLVAIVVTWGRSCVNAMDGAPGEIVGATNDLSFVEDWDLLLANTARGLVKLRLDGTENTQLVPARAFSGLEEDWMWMEDWAVDRSAVVVIAHSEAFLVQLDPPSVQRVGAKSGNVDAHFSPDGSQLAVVSGQHLWVVSVRTGVPRSLALGTRIVHLDGWTRDGKQVLLKHVVDDSRSATEYACEAVDGQSLLRHPMDCWAWNDGAARLSWEPAVNCDSVGSLESSVAGNLLGRSERPATYAGKPDGIYLKTPGSNLRLIIAVAGFEPPLQLDGPDAAQFPALGDPIFSSSCRYFFFNFGQDVYVAEISSGKVALLLGQVHQILPFRPVHRRLGAAQPQ